MTLEMKKLTSPLIIIIAVITLLDSYEIIAQNSPPPFLNDRGTGIPTSLFGTFIKKGELMVYPFFEYTIDHNLEYQPAQYGLGVDEDFRAGETSSFVRGGRLELPHPFGHQILSLARLPIPPPAHGT